MEELHEYWGAGGRRCGSCEAAPAAVHCRTCGVGSYLCTACDARPAHAHARLGHDRVWMCEEVPTAVACEADGAVLSATCDVDIHGTNPLDIFPRFCSLLSRRMLRLGKLDARLQRHGVGLADAIVEFKSEAERLVTVVNGVKGWVVGNMPLARSVRELMYDAEDGIDGIYYFSRKPEIQGVLARAVEPEGMVGDGAEHADASTPDNIGRKNRSKERDYFHITPAVNGEPAKAKCIDCGTQVVFSHGTSVLRKHRNSARCKNKRAAIEDEEPNYPSPYSTQNGAIILTNASEGTKRMTTKNNVATITLDWVKVKFSERIHNIHEIALQFGCMRVILESFQPGQLNAWIDRVGIACAFKELKAEVERMEMLVNGVNGRAVGNKPLAHSPVRVEQLDYRRLQYQVQGGMLSPAIEPEGMDGEKESFFISMSAMLSPATEPQGMDGEEDRDEAEQVGASSSSSIPNKRGRKNRSEAWDFFQLTPAVNGEAAKAKCVDCGTEVQWGYGTSVLHKHRNSASCKRKRAAIGETSSS